MTVSSTTTRNSYSGDGSTTAFAYGFKIFASSDLTVILRSATGVETVQTETTHYTVSNVGVASGGNVTFGSAPASGVTVVIRRNSPLTQLTDYTPNDPFPADDHENALDKLTFIAQQQQEELDRSIKLSRTNTMTSTEFTTSATDRASKILAFDTSGELSVTQELGTFRGDFAASTAYNIRDLVKDTSTGNVFFVNEAHTSSGSEPLTSNANASKYSLLLDATQGVTAGTVAAGKVTVVDSSKDLTGLRNLTITGELDAATLDISGNVDVDGTLETDALTIDGVTLAETISDTVGAMVGSNTETGISVTYDDSDNTLDFVIGSGSIASSMIAADAITGAKIADDAINSEHYTDGSIDTAHIADDQVTQAKIADDAVGADQLASNAVVTASITDGNVTTDKIADDAVTLAKMAGLARGKIIVGDSSGNPTALALGSNGEFLKSDGNDLVFGAATISGLAADDLTAGDAAINLTTTSGNITIDAQANDSDIIFKGTDDSSDTTFLTLDGSSAGEATFNDNIVFGTASKGVYLGVTSATASNLLDDYEEGTWTPSDGSGASLSLTVGSAHYVKIGGLVHVQAFITFPTTSNGNNVQINGLPFTVKDSNGYSAGAANSSYSDFLCIQFTPNATNFVGRKDGNVAVTNANMSAKFLIFGASYYSEA